VSAKGQRIERKQEDHLWGRLLHCQQSEGRAPTSAASPSRLSLLVSTGQLCLLSSGPGGDSGSGPPARVAVAWEEAFGGLRGIRWPNSCSWLLGQARDGVADGAACQALQHGPIVGRRKVGLQESSAGASA